MQTEASKQISIQPDRRVLVVGSSNVGKTSMLNELCQLNLKVSSDAIGCTLSTTSLPPIQRGSCQYTFFDTAGLNETDTGAISSDQAIKNIIHLINTARGGFNLLIFVMRIGAIQNSDKSNYDLFADVLTHKKIPIMGVITGCENEDPITEYATRNRPYYEDNQMNFVRIESTCFAKGGKLENVIYKRARFDSGQRVWRAIESIASKTSIKFINEENLGTQIRRMWNIFCDWIGKPTWRATVNKDLYDILDRMGIQEEGTKRRIAETVLKKA